MLQPQSKLQRQMFEEPPAVPAILLPLEAQQQLRQALVQWMQAVIKIIREEDDDE